MFFMGLVNDFLLHCQSIIHGDSLHLSTMDRLHNEYACDVCLYFCPWIVVDDAIVVIENTHRIHRKTKMDITSSAKFAAGEVFVPILSGTLQHLPHSSLLHSGQE